MTSPRWVSTPLWILLDSTSRQLDPQVVGEEHYKRGPLQCRARCSATRNCATSSPFWAWTNWHLKTKLTVARARKIQRFLSQPFHVAEVFTGAPGKYVPWQKPFAASR